MIFRAVMACRINLSCKIFIVKKVFDMHRHSSCWACFCIFSPWLYNNFYLWTFQANWAKSKRKPICICKSGISNSKRIKILNTLLQISPLKKENICGLIQWGPIDFEQQTFYGVKWSKLKASHSVRNLTLLENQRIKKILANNATFIGPHCTRFSQAIDFLLHFIAYHVSAAEKLLMDLVHKAAFLA